MNWPRGLNVPASALSAHVRRQCDGVRGLVRHEADAKGSLSVIARDQLQDLLARSVDREDNIVSALVEAVTR